MRGSYVAIVAMMMFLLACGGSKTAKVEEETPDDSAATENDTIVVDTQEELIADEPVPMAVDELFDDFIFNFAANQKMQKERILFPLRKNVNGHVDSMTVRQWQMDYFFMKQGYYTLLFNSQQEMEVVKDTSLNEAIVEKIFLDDDCVEQYCFGRIRGRWMLREIRKHSLSANANGSFLTFYKHFVSDSTFQLKSLASQIEFVGPDPDDDFAQMEGVILPEYWDVFAPELPSGLLYNIVYGKEREESDTKIFVLRGIANGLEMEVTFSKKSGQWKLTKLIT